MTILKTTFTNNIKINQRKVFEFCKIADEKKRVKINCVGKKMRKKQRSAIKRKYVKNVLIPEINEVNIGFYQTA